MPPATIVLPLPRGMTAGGSPLMNNLAPLPCASQSSMPQRMQAPKLELRSQEQNSCAYRNQPLDGHKLSGPMKAVELPSPMSPWEPLPSMNRRRPRAICPPVTVGLTPLEPTNSAIQAWSRSNLAFPISPLRLTLRFPNSRTTAIAINPAWSSRQEMLSLRLSVTALSRLLAH